MTFLSSHWDELEADFLRFYQSDLRRVLWVERVGCRRMWALLSKLPPSGAFKKALVAEAKPPAPVQQANGWRALARRMTGSGR